MRAGLIALCFLVACGPGSGPALEPADEIDCDDVELVRASEVEITGRRLEAVAGVILATDRLTAQQHAAVQWTLSRFELAELKLPAQVEVAFDGAGSLCHGEIGECRPDQRVPVLFVCVPPGVDQASDEAKVVLLHEMAHIWHWSQGDGTTWPDYSDIVGGDYRNDNAPAADRAEERVAMIISWGLLDRTDRPVLPKLTCTETYLAFETLTGTKPLGPVDPLCIP